MERVQLPQGYVATTKRQSTFNYKVSKCANKTIYGVVTRILRFHEIARERVGNKYIKGEWYLCLLYVLETTNLAFH